MSYYARVLAAVLCAGAACAQTFAQNPPAPAPTPRPASTPAPASSPTAAPQRRGGRPAAATPAADQAVAARREAAVTLINRLAEEARGFRNETLRARTLAQAADALWETERESARALFRRAWEAADATDRESVRRQAEERQRMMNERRGGGTFVLPRVSNLRNEVLRLAARRDRALGEEFLAQLAEARSEAAAGPPRNSPPAEQARQAAQPAPFDPMDPPPIYRQRLQLARQLLDEGDIERALQIAEPALDRVTVSGVSFLSALQEKNTALADGRYAALLARAANDPATDAVAISLLSSYVFSPFTYTVVSRSGSMSMSEREQTAPPAGLSPALRDSFLNFAFRVLVRPLPPPEQDNSIAGRSGAYFTIARLLPLFEQFKPEQASMLRTQLAALAPETQENVRDPRNPMLTRGLQPDDPDRDAEHEALDRAERATTSAARDQAYASAATSAASKGEARARDIADKIEESDLRANVRAYVDFVLLQRAIRNKETDKAIQLARDGQITRPQRVWALTQIAGWLPETERELVTELLDEAGTEARRIGGTEPDRARALVAVATHMVKADPERAWDLAAEVVRAANATDEFTGTDAQISAMLRTQNSVIMTNFAVQDFDLTGLFAALAQQDMQRAVELSRGLVGESPRATATLAIARAVLGGEERRAERRVTADAEVVR